MASAVAATAGKLAKMPYIGKYARATEMVAGTMGKVASLFGFSKPAIISDYVDMKPSYIGRLAYTSGGDNATKLTVDPKQELTIDPSVMGLSGVDEMSLSYLTSKESYLTQFPWTVARVPGDALFSIRVGPVAKYTAPFYYIPALTYVTNIFKYWRGSIVYRFQIVASGFHKGRLLIVWDPLAQTSGPETNVQYSKIVDLSNERDFTFEVGWGSPLAWLECSLSTVTTFSNNVVFTSNSSSNYNGVVSVYVLNELTTPNSTANNDISVNVFIAGCEDFKVAVPTDNVSALVDRNATVPQSGTFEEVDTMMKNAPRVEMTKETIAACEPLTDGTDAVYMGESIVSLRSLMKRYAYHTSLNATTNTSNSVQTLTLTDFPSNRGYSLYGMVLKTANNYNPTITTLLNYLSYAYAGYRGGIRRKVIINTSDIGGSNSAIVARIPTEFQYGAIAAASVADVVTTPLAYSVNKVNNQWPRTNVGAHATLTRHQPNIEYEVPYYRNYRFSSPRNLGTKGAFAADAFAHRITTQAPANAAVTYDIYVAAAEDTTFMCFQGCPPLQNLIIS
jgi:hypothetical protein